MNIEQVIELVEKWLADNSSVTIKELEAAADYAHYPWSDAITATYAGWANAAADAAAWAANSAANSPAAAAHTAWAAKHVAEYRKLAKQEQQVIELAKKWLADSPDRR
jgi:hypothetical protein